VDVADLDLTSVDHVLTTTRAVRRRLDLTRPVEPEIIRHCLDIALQAPIGFYGETRHFIIVSDPEIRSAIAALYRKAAEGRRRGTVARDAYLTKLRITDAADPNFARQQRMFASNDYLVEHMHEVPLLLVACIEGRVEDAGAGAQASLYASIMPAVWSLMLALRARGIGSTLATAYIQSVEKELAQILGIPDAVTQAALLPIAYFKGSDFKRAGRALAGERTHWNRW